MRIEIAKPKWVKKARQWCVTIFINGRQSQKWFDTEKEAREYKPMEAKT